jgi:hypothetical protein
MNLSLFTQYQVPQTPKAMTLHKLKPQFASELNREWHSRLPVIHWSNIVRNRNYICYGACYDWQYFGFAGKQKCKPIIMITANR